MIFIFPKPARPSESPALDIPREEDPSKEEEDVSAVHVEESGAVPFDANKVRWIERNIRGPIGYGDSAGKPKKCHCQRSLLYPMISSIRRYFLGPKNCHYRLAL